MIGIEFTLKNGLKENYDPVNYPDDFSEEDEDYILNMTYKYTVPKS